MSHSQETDQQETQSGEKGKKRKPRRKRSETSKCKPKELAGAVPDAVVARKRQKRCATENNYVAMDCEMVGVGFKGENDMVARVSIVNKTGKVLLDKYVKPHEVVVDYRTSVSGIRPHDINNGEDFNSVQTQVVQILTGKILVGHAIRKDLAVLNIKHPTTCTRDTSFYKPLRRLVANGRTPSLKHLSQVILGKEIQTGEHSSVEDARAAMSIYNYLDSDWEAYIRRHQEKIAKKGKKRKPKRKRSETSKCKPKELADAVRDAVVVAEKKPSHTLMEHLQMDYKSSIVSRKAAGSNWETVTKISQREKHICDENNIVANGEENRSEAPVLSKSARKRQKRCATENNYVAMDCEMVGVGFKGENDMVARVSIVNKTGKVLLDKYVKPRKVVVDYRTSVSGIRPHDINNGEDFNSVQTEVVQILTGKILVGHAIHKDLAVLNIEHPTTCTRDTSFYKPLRRLVANGRTPSLKHLSQVILGKEIQTGEHSSVEDARAAMSIYNYLASDWEAYIRRHQKKIAK